MKSGYIYLDESELIVIKNALSKYKDDESLRLALKLDNYRNNYWDLKNKSFANFKTLATEKFNTINSELISNEEVTIDDDALVAVSKNGAYVHCWMWVENAAKPKRTRKKSV